MMVLRFERGGTGGGEIVELMAFGKERGFAGVDVFGLGIGRKPAPAEGDDAPAPIGDRKHQPVVEKIAQPPALIRRTRQACRDHIVER